MLWNLQPPNLSTAAGNQYTDTCIPDTQDSTGKPKEPLGVRRLCEIRLQRLCVGLTVVHHVDSKVPWRIFPFYLKLWAVTYKLEEMKRKVLIFLIFHLYQETDLQMIQPEKRLEKRNLIAKMWQGKSTSLSHMLHKTNKHAGLWCLAYILQLSIMI